MYIFRNVASEEGENKVPNKDHTWNAEGDSAGPCESNPAVVFELQFWSTFRCSEDEDKLPICTFTSGVLTVRRGIVENNRIYVYLHCLAFILKFDLVSSLKLVISLEITHESMNSFFIKKRC